MRLPEETKRWGKGEERREVEDWKIIKNQKISFGNRIVFVWREFFQHVAVSSDTSSCSSAHRGVGAITERKNLVYEMW